MSSHLSTSPEQPTETEVQLRAMLSRDSELDSTPIPRPHSQILSRTVQGGNEKRGAFNVLPSRSTWSPKPTSSSLPEVGASAAMGSLSQQPSTQPTANVNPARPPRPSLAGPP